MPGRQARQWPPQDGVAAGLPWVLDIHAADAVQLAPQTAMWKCCERHASTVIPAILSKGCLDNKGKLSCMPKANTWRA